MLNQIIIKQVFIKMQSHLETTSRLDAKKQACINHLTLENDQILRALVLMEQMISSSRGPFGKIKMVQNSHGGHLTMTSTSSRLLSSMSFSNPIAKLVVSSAQGHLQTFSDGGHLLMSFSLNLILGSLRLDISRRILTDLYEIFLTMCVEYLTNFSNIVSFSDLKQMSSMVMSILTSKPLCRFTLKHVRLYSSLILECFLSSLPDGNAMGGQVTDGVTIVTVEGESMEKSTLLQGLLLQCPEVASHSKQNMITLRTKAPYILVALVAMSMSGDTEETGSMQFESDISVDTENIFLQSLEEFCDKLVVANVRLLLCQKVVHPWLKQYLRERSVVVVERLGATMIPYIQDVSGAVPIRCIGAVDVDWLGKVAHVEHRIIQEKSYLLLTPLAEQHVMTLVLYSPDEEQLSELKSLCSTCLMSLRHLLRSPHVLFGGGCWQTRLSALLKNKVKADQGDIIEKTGCTRGCLMEACNIFTNTLEKIAIGTDDKYHHMSDFESGHLWHLPKCSNPDTDVVLKCSCGAFKQNISKLSYIGEDTVKIDRDLAQSPPSFPVVDSDVVLDLSATCVSALTSGVLTANTVLSIGQFIQDIN